MRVAIISGSFDPITIGHMHIVKTASNTFDSVIVAIAHNPNKKYMYTHEQRVRMAHLSIKDYGLTNVAVELLDSNTLTVEFAMEHRANILVRGIRNSSDLEYEQELMLLNNDVQSALNFPELQTFFVLAPKNLSSVSSTMIRSLINNPKTFNLINNYVTPSVSTFVKQFFKVYLE